MTYNQILNTMQFALSHYMIADCKSMREGKYSSGDHYRDGIISMMHETLQELYEGDDYAPLSKTAARQLISAFNRLTGEAVPNVWATQIIGD